MDTINNVAKARRTCYSLLSPRLHGNNGLDPVTLLHLIQTFVIPTLLYSLDMLLPSNSHLTIVETFIKKLLKQIFSLPTNTPDPVPYILAGLIPIEGQIHMKALTFLNSVFLLPEESTEKRIARRQLSIKDVDSASWFIEMKKILIKYDLPDINQLLDNSHKKEKWKTLVYRHLHIYWQDEIINISNYYRFLTYLNPDIYTPG
jgi:hypothetical protein